MQICPEKFSGLFYKKDSKEEESYRFAEINEKYRIGSKYKKIVIEAWKNKLKTIAYLNDPEVKREIFLKAYFKAIRKCMISDEKYAEKIFKLGKTKKKISTRELERHFSNLMIKHGLSKGRQELDFILSLYDGTWELSRGKKRNQESIIFTRKDRLIHPREKMISETRKSLGSLKANK